MLQKRLMLILSLAIAMSMVLTACGGSATPAATQAAATAGPTAVTATTRHGGWLDEIDFSVVTADSAVTQLGAGAIDVYASGLSSADFPTIKKAGLSYAAYNGLYYDIMYNPAVFKDTNTLNPFADRKLREATNWLYDRSFINQEVYAGGGLLKWFPIQTNGPDYADLADVARGLEAKYAYNADKAKQAISAEMTTLGATLGPDGKWQFKGKPVSLIFLIRTDSDGTRKPLGDYAATQLESVGFTVDRQYKKSSEASPLWLHSDPADGKWTVYTAAWSAPAISRDDRNQFQQMYLPTSQQGSHPFLDNTSADPAYQKLGDDLANAKFSDLATRHTMMAQALALGLQDSLQVWLIDGKNYAPYSNKVQVSSDLAAGIEVSQVGPYTARFIGKEGGTLKWGEPDQYGDPWNPIAGSNWTFDHAAYNMTNDAGTMNDPYTGLVWPLRVDKAEVTVQTGLPVGKTLDWVTLKTADKISVPSDALVDWDPKAQKFITAADALKTKAVIDGLRSQASTLAGAVDFTKFNAAALNKYLTDVGAFYTQTSGNALDVATALADKANADTLAGKLKDINAAAAPADKQKALAQFAMDFLSGLDTTGTFARGAIDFSTAKLKSVVTYPADLFDKVKWHDGSSLSVADFVMGMIMTFDRAYPASPIYDPQAVPGFQSFQSYFKGFRITSTAPLTIEFYTDSFAQDAELDVTSLWPGGGYNYVYGYGEGSWHVLALGNLAEAAGKLAWSPDKATSAKIEEVNLVGGPSLDILNTYLTQAEGQSYIPYAPTLSQYITADQAKARYDNLKTFYAAHSHFWIGTGPYILDKVFLTGKTLTLKTNPNYSDLADRWSSFGEPKIADAVINPPSGPVKIGADASFDVAVTFKGQPYPAAEIKQVKYLLYDATGAVVSVGDATAVADGQYKVTLPAAVTSKLTAGSNKLEVAVISLSVAIPTFTSVQFVTAP
jgi:hypothetical protein